MEQVKLLMTELSPELTRLCAETLAAQDIAAVSYTHLDVYKRQDLRMDENVCGVMRDGITGLPKMCIRDTPRTAQKKVRKTADDEVAGP